MRRLLVVFIIPACAIAGIVLLFTLFNTPPAGAFPSHSDQSELQAIDPVAAILPISDKGADPAGPEASTSRSDAGPVSSLIKPDADLSVAAAPLAALQMDVNYAQDWVAGTTDAFASVMVTVTDYADDPQETATLSADGSGDFFVGCDQWDSGNCPDISPGDSVFASVVGATAEINPVGSITGKLHPDSDVITGTLNAAWLSNPADVQCEIWEDGGPTIAQTADPDGGEFICDFTGVWDLYRGDYVVLRYLDGSNSVVNRIAWPFAHVNYVHDWAQLTYELGHTVWVTVTDDLGGYKASASGVTNSNDGWGGPGFSTGLWWPPNLDIVPGDFVYFATDDGYSNVVEVGDIGGAIDIDNDHITGTISASYAVSLTVDCAPWGAWDQGIDTPGKADLVLPDGVDTYLCAWDPGG